MAETVYRTNIKSLPYVTVDDTIQVGELVYGGTQGMGFRPVYYFMVELKGHDHLMLKEIPRNEGKFYRVEDTVPFLGGRLD